MLFFVSGRAKQSGTLRVIVRCMPDCEPCLLPIRRHAGNALD
jgi:hypothetical protein